MRRIHRAVVLALLIGIGPVIAGCSDFDPDKLDVLGLNQKKKLPGERHPLFPEGVPGVSQGVPPEYLKGNLAEQSGAAVPIDPLKPEQAAQTASAGQQSAEEKPKPKPKARKRVAAKPKPTRVEVSSPKTQPHPAQAAPPWPSAPPPPAQQPAQQASSPWPDQQQQAPAPWPSAPAPGTFSKQ
ncbi:MAG TPA: hypothetical protein VIJ67_09800 [Pseudolabrys sp.]|jgi:hypothetical protein